MKQFRNSVLALMLAGPLTGCNNLGYYAQAVGGQVAVMRAAQPIGDVLGDPAGDPGLKKQLEDQHPGLVASKPGPIPSPPPTK